MFYNVLYVLWFEIIISIISKRFKMILFKNTSGHFALTRYYWCIGWAKEAAALKKRELKELAQKAIALPKKEIEVKAAEYDKLGEEKNSFHNLAATTTRNQINERSTKKVNEVKNDIDDEEEVMANNLRKCYRKQ